MPEPNAASPSPRTRRPHALIVLLSLRFTQSTTLLILILLLLRSQLSTALPSQVSASLSFPSVLVSVAFYYAGISSHLHLREKKNNTPDGLTALLILLDLFTMGMFVFAAEVLRKGVCNICYDDDVKHMVDVLYEDWERACRLLTAGCAFCILAAVSFAGSAVVVKWWGVVRREGEGSVA